MTETPQEFDLDAWIDGADRPTRSVTVYQKAGLIADLDALEERINNANLEGVEHIEERRLGEQSEAQRLTAEYRRIAQQFHDSALTIKVQGHGDEEKREFLTDQPEGVVYRVLADAIISPKATAEQVKRIEKKIGPAQFGLILSAYQQASTEIPIVSADFLPKPSTRDDGGE